MPTRIPHGIASPAASAMATIRPEAGPTSFQQVFQSVPGCSVTNDQLRFGLVAKIVQELADAMANLAVAFTVRIRISTYQSG